MNKYEKSGLFKNINYITLFPFSSYLKIDNSKLEKRTKNNALYEYKYDIDFFEYFSDRIKNNKDDETLNSFQKDFIFKFLNIYFKKDFSLIRDSELIKVKNKNMEQNDLYFYLEDKYKHIYKDFFCEKNLKKISFFDNFDFDKSTFFINGFINAEKSFETNEKEIFIKLFNNFLFLDKKDKNFYDFFKSLKYHIEKSNLNNNDFNDLKNKMIMSFGFETLKHNQYTNHENLKSLTDINLIYKELGSDLFFDIENNFISMFNEENINQQIKLICKYFKTNFDIQNIKTELFIKDMLLIDNDTNIINNQYVFLKEIKITSLLNVILNKDNFNNIDLFKITVKDYLSNLNLNIFDVRQELLDLMNTINISNVICNRYVISNNLLNLDKILKIIDDYVIGNQIKNKQIKI